MSAWTWISAYRETKLFFTVEMCGAPRPVLNYSKYISAPFDLLETQIGYVREGFQKHFQIVFSHFGTWGPWTPDPELHHGWKARCPVCEGQRVVRGKLGWYQGRWIVWPLRNPMESLASSDKEQYGRILLWACGWLEEQVWLMRTEGWWGEWLQVCLIKWRCGQAEWWKNETYWELQGVTGHHDTTTLLLHQTVFSKVPTSSIIVAGTLNFINASPSCWQTSKSPSVNCIFSICDLSRCPSPALFLSHSKLGEGPMRSKWQRTTSKWRCLDFCRPDFCIHAFMNIPPHGWLLRWGVGKARRQHICILLGVCPLWANTQGAVR